MMEWARQRAVEKEKEAQKRQQELAQQEANFSPRTLAFNDVVALVKMVGIGLKNFYQVRAVRACVRACGRACVRACVRSCVCMCVWGG